MRRGGFLQVEFAHPAAGSVDLQSLAERQLEQ